MQNQEPAPAERRTQDDKLEARGPGPTEVLDKNVTALIDVRDLEKRDITIVCVSIIQWRKLFRKDLSQLTYTF